MKVLKTKCNRAIHSFGCVLLLIDIALLAIVPGAVGYTSLVAWVPGLLAVVVGILLIVQPRFDVLVTALFS